MARRRLRFFSTSRGFARGRRGRGPGKLPLLVPVDDVAGKGIGGPVVDIAAVELGGVDLPAARYQHEQDVVLVGQLQCRVDTVHAHGTYPKEGSPPCR